MKKGIAGIALPINYQQENYSHFSHCTGILACMIFSLMPFINSNAQSYQQFWMKIKLAVPSGDSLTRLSTQELWNAGALSSNVIPASASGWVEFVTNKSTSYYIVGFSHQDHSVGPEAYRHSFVINSNHTFSWNETGTMLQAGTWKPGDRFRLSRQGGTITYQCNGKVLRTIYQDATYELKAKVSILRGSSPRVTSSHDAQIFPVAIVTGTDLSGQNGSILLNPIGGKTPYQYHWEVINQSTNVVANLPSGRYTVTITDAAGHRVTRTYELGYKSIFSEIVNATETPQGLRMNTAGWSGAITAASLPANMPGWLEFAVDDSPSIYEIGFTNTLGRDVSDFSNGVHVDRVIDRNTTYETFTSSFNGSVQPGDVFRITRSGSVVTYFRNGTSFRTVNVNATTSLRLKTSIYVGNAPSFVSSLGMQSAVSTVVDNLAFQYRYDSRRRMIARKTPGADWVYMVYDARDRLVLAQDGNLRTTNQWSFTKYDELNRPVLTGITDPIVNANQAAMQVTVDNGYKNGTYKWFETRSTAPGNVHFYSNQSYPPVSDPNKYLTVTNFDEYTSDRLRLGFSPSEFGTPLQMSFSRNVGLTTGSKVKVFDGTNVWGGSSWLVSCAYYDDKNRLIQTVGDNHKGGIDRVSSKYDFPGKLLATKTSSTVAGVTRSVSRRFVYDHAGRLLVTRHHVNGEDTVTLARNDYNELGQLKTKKLHSTNNSFFNQCLDYRYNIRGWLTSMNGAGLTNSAPNSCRDLFGFDLIYNQSEPALANQPMFNGNISAMRWSQDQQKENAYVYSYDAMNRFTAAFLTTRTSSWNSSISNSEKGVSYDLNGNVTKLSRTGDDGALMDVLTYNYGAGIGAGNRLLKVTDAGQRAKGFIDANTNSNDFTYDSNGNLATDRNKGITTPIAYNILNLPEKIIKDTDNNLKISYDATGRKLYQVLKSNGEVTTTDYLGEFQFENDRLQLITHEEGRFVYGLGNSNGTYQYNLKDHLGNVRMTFSPRREVDIALATLENSSISEQSQFLNYDKIRGINSNIFDHTNDQVPQPGSSYALRLNGSGKERIGLAKSLAVMPGDTLRLGVYAKYYEPFNSRPGTAFTILMKAIIDGVTQTGTFVDGAAYSGAPAAFPFSATLAKPSGTSAVPQAYLNWLVFDKDYNPIQSQSGYKQITIAAREDTTNSAHEYIRPDNDIIIAQAGFAYIWLSNENPTPAEVYFDDFKIEHIKSPIVQSQDYYPFGLTYNSNRRENEISGKYLFSGKEHLDALSMDLDDFGARMYDPTLGKWLSPDPHADSYQSYSPYNYALNNPANVIDPDGNDVYVLTWFSKNDETGHAGIAIDNYKTQNKKDSNGKDVLDSNGKPVTEQVKDGTFTYFDLWPNDPVGPAKMQDDVKADYSRGVVVNSLKELTDTDVTTSRNGRVSPEGRAADGIVKLSTSFDQDSKARKQAWTDIKAGKMYNACNNNCSTFAQGVLNAALAPNPIDASQMIKPSGALQLMYNDAKVVAPNNLYNTALGVNGAVLIKGPASVTAKPYLEYFGKSNRP